MTRRQLSSALLCAFAQGCSSPAAAPPPPPPPPVAPVDPGPGSMESEIGGMNEAAVERAFAAIQPAVLDCVNEGAKRIKELGGRFELSLRIDREGAARWVYLRASTLGDRSVERCIADVARAHTWPRPVGGEGLANRAFEIDAGRAPVEWEEKRVRTALELDAGKLARCRGRVAGTFLVTGYVRSDGKVVGVGVAPPDADAEEAADCIAETVARWRFGYIGRRSAKFSVALEP